MSNADRPERPTASDSGQTQFLNVVTRDEATARFREHLRLAPLGKEIAAAASGAESRPCRRCRVGGGRSRLRSLQRRRLRPAGHRHVRRDGGNAAEGDAQRRSPCAGCRADQDGGLRRRDADRDGRDAAARRRCGADGRAFGSASMPGRRMEIRRALTEGENVSYAGTDIARGETVLRAGVHLTSREIGVLAALGLAEIVVYRRPRVAIFSTGNEIVAPGHPLRPGAVYDSNAAIIGAAVEELGGVAVHLGVIPDDEERAGGRARARSAIRSRDLLRAARPRAKAISRTASWDGLRNPGRRRHGVALKPGKPICLAVTDGKPVVILPGFPTSAIFTFHEFVAPVIRAFAGLPVERRQSVAATLPDARELRARTNRVSAGRPGAGTAGPLRLSDGQRLRFRDHVQRRGRLHHHRPAHRDPRCRQHGFGPAPRARSRARRPRHHRQPLRRPRSPRSAS